MAKAASKGPIVRKATMSDAADIQALVNRFAGEKLMLSRSLSEIYENIRDYFVIDDGGAVAGSAALHFFWKDLAEVRALAVAGEYQDHGLGRKLVQACCREAAGMGIRRLFALTFQPAFFQKCGFSVISKDELPHKVWSDCIKCPMFPNCDETAVLLEIEEATAGERPRRSGRRR